MRLTDDKVTDVFEVLEVKEGKFRTAFKPQGSKVFVYGREVSDFRMVDYDAIAMLRSPRRNWPASWRWWKRKKPRRLPGWTN